MWFFLALISALFYSFRRFSEKKISQKTNPFTIAFAIQVFSLPGIALMMLFVTIPDILSLSTYFWVPLLFIWIVLYPIQSYFYYRSLNEGEISYVLPLMSFIPIINIISSWYLIGELPSPLGFLGILVIVAGIYTLNMKPNTHFLSPVLHLFRDRPSLFMITACTCLAFGATLDKIAIEASEPVFYSFVNTAGASVVIFLIAKFTAKNYAAEIRGNIKGLALLGGIQAIAFSSYTVAMTTGIVPYVLAFKGTAAVLGSVWGFIFLKETFNKFKVIALIFIALGLGLIAFA